METEERFCRLEEIQGRKVPCPEDKCAFWEPGSAAVEGWCVLHGIDFAQEPGLAEWLTELRATVGSAADEP